ncbi:MAG: aminoacyl-tRNA hydrolase [Porphyromonas sp.]|nr:aminoacyl-tRNA hydrolase [Porphyromonas sp.]
MNKYLIVGLGNIGPEYVDTRHNAGFMVVDRLAEELGATFESRRYGDRAEVRLKNKILILLKPSTYMNLSGNAVRYWLNEEKIPMENLLVIADELALPFGSLRIRTKGSSGGHNGLKHIEATLGSQAYARLRVGIGDDFSRGQQIAYVLEPFSEEERTKLPDISSEGAEIVKSFCLAGIEVTMNSFNKKAKTPKKKNPPISVKREEEATKDEQ